jgi:transposase
LFGSTFDFLFYDITSTYFEGTAKGNAQAKRGYSRDGRPDCPQVCIGLVTTREGLPLAFEIFERNSRAASLFNVTVTESGTGKELRLCIYIKKNEERHQWAMETGGSYILRTNWTESDPKTLWNTYIQLTEVEDCFRTEKHDLGMRPIFHRKQERTRAHILVCFLALTMWRTLQQWMKASGLGTAPRKLLEELRELKSLDVLLPTREKNLRLRMVATPDNELKVLLQRMKILLPNKPKIIENVVTKMA